MQRGRTTSKVCKEVDRITSKICKEVDRITSKVCKEVDRTTGKVCKEVEQLVLLDFFSADTPPQPSDYKNILEIFAPFKTHRGIFFASISLPSKYDFFQFQVPGFHQWGDRMSCLLVQNHHSPAFWHCVLTKHFILAAATLSDSSYTQHVELKISECPHILCMWSSKFQCPHILACGANPSIHRLLRKQKTPLCSYVYHVTTAPASTGC